MHDAPLGSAEPSTQAPSRFGNLPKRLLTAAVVVPLLLYLLFVAPSWGFIVLLVVASIVAAAELFAMTLPRSWPLRAWGLLITPLWLLSLAYGAQLGLRRDVIGTVIVLGGMIAALIHPKPIERASQTMAWLIAGPMYVGGLLGALAMLFLRDHGGAWVVLAMMLSWLSDTGGYFAGRAWGHHKLYPAVSPKKTIEGSLGGVAGSTLGALLAHFWYLPELPLTGAIGLGVGAGLLGQAGDLCESLIKRSTGVKDSGQIVPGHGGMLDRIDALLFTAAITWLYAEWLFV